MWINIWSCSSRLLSCNNVNIWLCEIIVIQIQIWVFSLNYLWFSHINNKVRIRTTLTENPRSTYCVRKVNLHSTLSTWVMYPEAILSVLNADILMIYFRKAIVVPKKWKAMCLGLLTVFFAKMEWVQVEDDTKRMWLKVRGGSLNWTNAVQSTYLL